MDYNHAWSLKEDARSLFTCIVRVHVLFSLGKGFYITSPADASEGGILQKQTTLGFVI